VDLYIIFEVLGKHESISRIRSLINKIEASAE